LTELVHLKNPWKLPFARVWKFFLKFKEPLKLDEEKIDISVLDETNASSSFQNIYKTLIIQHPLDLKNTAGLLEKVKLTFSNIQKPQGNAVYYVIIDCQTSKILEFIVDTIEDKMFFSLLKKGQNSAFHLNRKRMCLGENCGEIALPKKLLECKCYSKFHSWCGCKICFKLTHGGFFCENQIKEHEKKGIHEENISSKKRKLEESTKNEKEKRAKNSKISKFLPKSTDRYVKVGEDKVVHLATNGEFSSLLFREIESLMEYKSNLKKKHVPQCSRKCRKCGNIFDGDATCKCRSTILLLCGHCNQYVCPNTIKNHYSLQ
jgi:hypothetical protein